MRAIAFAVTMLSACWLQTMPPIVIVRSGEPAKVHRVVLLPSECATPLCKAVDQMVAAELSFRGYEVVEPEKLNAVERKRTEVILEASEQVNGTTTMSRRQRQVTVEGPTFSDVDIWTLRDELAAMQVDSIVRVRTVEIFAKPRRIAAIVRITRASDAKLISTALCEMEFLTEDTFNKGAERTTRCALQQVLR